MTDEGAKVNHAFMRKVAAERVRSSLDGVGYRQSTITAITTLLAKAISDDSGLTPAEISKHHSELILLLDSEEDQSFPEGSLDADY